MGEAEKSDLFIFFCESSHSSFYSFYCSLTSLTMMTSIHQYTFFGGFGGSNIPLRPKVESWRLFCHRVCVSAPVYASSPTLSRRKRRGAGGPHHLSVHLYPRGRKKRKRRRREKDLLFSLDRPSMDPAALKKGKRRRRKRRGPRPPVEQWGEKKRKKKKKSNKTGGGGGEIQEHTDGDR